MKQLVISLVVILFAVHTSIAGETSTPRVFIESQEGFESYIAAAMVKKKVPVTVTANKDDAAFVLTSVVEGQEESTGSKIARCLFAYCAGIGGSQTATVQLVNAATKEVVWAYNVKKGGAKNYQSSAESIAKHLKRYISDHPNKFASSK
jgi:hypothetical protein